MQPEPTAVSQHTPFLDSPRAEPLDPTQHGHDFCGEDPVSGPSRYGKTGDRSEVVPGSARDEADSPLKNPEDKMASSSQSQQPELKDSLQPSVSFEDFPNGESRLLMFPRFSDDLTSGCTRGLDSYPVPPASSVAVVDRIGFPSLP